MRELDTSVSDVLRKYYFLRPLAKSFHLLHANVELVDDRLLGRRCVDKQTKQSSVILPYITSSSGSTFCNDEVGYDYHWQRHWWNPFSWRNPVRNETVLECMERHLRLPSMRPRAYVSFDFSHIVVLKPAPKGMNGHDLTLHKFPGEHTFKRWMAEREATAETTAINHAANI